MLGLFAEYWDTHSERDAWFQQHLSSQLHSLAVPRHQWCCDHSASWARGAVHIPVYSSPPSCKPAAPSSVTTTSVTGSKRRYTAITSNGRHRPQPSSSVPPDGPLSKAAREQEEYQQVLEVTLNLVASLGQIPGLLQELSLIHFVFGQANRAPSENHLCNRAISRHPSSSTQLVVQEILDVVL